MSTQAIVLIAAAVRWAAQAAAGAATVVPPLQALWHSVLVANFHWNFADQTRYIYEDEGEQMVWLLDNA